MDSTTRGVGCRSSPEYIRTVSGLLKFAQLVLSIIAFGTACAVADRTSFSSRSAGFGWVSFVAIFGFLMALISLLCHLMMSTTWSWPRIMELGWYALWTICFMIAGIVAAAMHHKAGEADRKNRVGYWTETGTDKTAAAAAAFSFFSMVVWAVDTVFQAMNFRVTVTTHSTTTTTTTVNTDVPQRFEGNPQY